MKTSFNKKLSINKRTVANLNSREMRAAKGGVLSFDPGTTCNWNETCPDTCGDSCGCETAYQWCTLSCGESVCDRCWTDYC
ncbi:MAG: hypothetical protein QG657_3000 [Acidobacteriota bacterium]|nr:hypothetical protein [Acidobacteriota bacterium]